MKLRALCESLYEALVPPEEPRNQLKESSVFEVSSSRRLRGSFLAMGRRVGRQAQIITTFNSIRDQRRKVVKSSAHGQDEAPIFEKNRAYE